MIAIITGRNGLIGKALWDYLKNLGWILTNYPCDKAKYFFHFASPSSDILFNKAQSYQIRETIEGIMNVCDYCYYHNIKLIYPSSANVYYLNSAYALTKKAVEEIVRAYKIPALGLRIFTGYGKEEHKSDYSSVVWKFISNIKQDKKPVIYGNGEQKRDFVYVGDIVRTIYDNLDRTGTIDIGTGVATSYNELIKLINKKLDKNIDPFYININSNYIMETICQNPIKNYTSLERGIELILDK